MEAFSELGITETEGKVLAHLIKSGPSTGSALAAGLGMHKSVVYFVLEQLTQKGWVSFVVVNKKKQYRAIDPSLMEARLQDRKKDFLKHFNTMLRSIHPPPGKGKKTLFHIFEGWDGMQPAFHDIIQQLGKGEEYLVFAVDVPEKVLPRFRRFIRRFQQARSEKGIECKVLVSSRLRSTIGKDRKSEAHTSVKFVRSEHAMPMAANIYADRVLMAVWAESPLAIIIENRETADSFRAFFRLLWKAGTY